MFGISPLPHTKVMLGGSPQTKLILLFDKPHLNDIFPMTSLSHVPQVRALEQKSNLEKLFIVFDTRDKRVLSRLSEVTQ